MKMIPGIDASIEKDEDNLLDKQGLSKDGMLDLVDIIGL